MMIQGFPVGDGLARIRNDLRTAFAHEGFDRLLDRRYKISTAHITALRFCQPGLDAEALLAVLEDGRQMDFGEMHVTSLQLIWGDWYASSNVVRTLQEYQLSDGYDQPAEQNHWTERERAMSASNSDLRSAASQSDFLPANDDVDAQQESVTSGEDLRAKGELDREGPLGGGRQVLHVVGCERRDGHGAGSDSQIVQQRDEYTNCRASRVSMA
jgi:hypothetical protein